ncbi:MAG: NADH-quinone oxidoreductase subunit B family protein [Desulfitobacteriaceae bacterium]
MSKPKLAIFDFACCEGCQLQIVNMEEEILNLISIVNPVQWREAMSEESDEYDIVLIEGSITRPEDEERLRRIREKAKVLVALGACAAGGGVNRLKNTLNLQEAKETVYGTAANMPHLNTSSTKAVDEVVAVDYKVYGCPIDRREFAYIVRCLALGKTPEIPGYPVCVECKLKENVCRYEYREICLGPLTRAGCGARCPSLNTWCFGCRGSIEEPNIDSAKEVVSKYGKTLKDLENRIALFGSK